MMKLKIKLGDNYSQQLLNDTEFNSMFLETINQDDLITEFWVKNTANQDEQSFRAQVLNNINVHFSRVFADRNPETDTNYDDQLSPISINGKLGDGVYRLIALIEEFEA